VNTDTLKETIRRELPALLREDPALRAFLQDLMREQFAERRETDDKFYRLLGELRRDREAQERKWEENRAEQRRLWQENADERKRLWQENADERKRLWQENAAERERRWEENKREFDRVHEEIMALAEKQDRSIGALGARWGIQSEATFRNALAGILERHFDVQVMRVEEFDDEGRVFGRPDQVELDLVVKNGLLIICELKSSISKAGIYAFERKVRFYEERHGCKADRLMVISPMIDERARKVAGRLGVELYSDSNDVREL
jgi:hypothetical protein